MNTLLKKTMLLLLAVLGSAAGFTLPAQSVKQQEENNPEYITIGDIKVLAKNLIIIQKRADDKERYYNEKAKERISRAQQRIEEAGERIKEARQRISAAGESIRKAGERINDAVKKAQQNKGKYNIDTLFSDGSLIILYNKK